MHVRRPFGAVPRRRRENYLMRAGIAALVALIGFTGVFGAGLLRQPAVAAELERLSAANAAWAQTAPLGQIDVVQEGLQPNFDTEGGPTYTLSIRSRLSLTIDDGGVTGTEEILARTFNSPADRENWEARGSPTLPEPGDVTRYRAGSAYNHAAAISTDPDELRRSLQDGSVAGFLPNDGQLFELIACLLIEPTLSVEQREALFDVVATLEGVELLGDIQDPLSREGVGFSYEVGERRQVLVFDRETGQPLAFEEYSAMDPTQIDLWQAFDPPTTQQ
jgi:hypothetical protein